MDTFSFHWKDPFPLESGAILPGFELVYSTAGKLNAAADNVVWVCHALTANAVVTDWWEGMIGPGCLLDPERHYIICVNMLGSCYGSTGPLSLNLHSGEPYYHDFPGVTVRDMVRAYDLLRQFLGITQIDLVLGGSMGGQQSLEWALEFPGVIRNLVPIATNAFHSPWGIAFNESQRMAIQADSTWKDRRPEAGLAGMRAARSMALLSYRNYLAYGKTQSESDPEKLDDYKASSYQRYQGEKLARRFNAFSYWTLSKAMDNHHVGRGRGGAAAALSSVKARTLVISISSDLLFPPEEQQFLARHIPNARLVEIDSPYGHDGFLIEVDQLTRHIGAFWKEMNNE